jgi:hypothetical protein
MNTQLIGDLFAEATRRMTSGSSKEFSEKFAQLIVEECEKSIKSVPTHFEAQDKIIVECLKSIRETFRS